MSKSFPARVPISSWATVKASEKTWHGLLIGNGASIALHPNFAYGSLYSAAVTAKRLPTTQPPFAALYGGTTNFEYVLLALSHATQVGKALGTSTSAARAAYAEVRQALIDTVNSVHPAHADVQAKLGRVADFSKAFDTIVTLNYDLLLGNA